jgi:ActR/RegA family two-component response regulator
MTITSEPRPATAEQVDDRPRVLCVDDEAAVLGAFVRLLRRRFDVTTAGDGRAGLDTIDREAPFAVVLSDLKMPRMDGIAFLEEAARRTPDSVRLLLTGHADLSTAIDAINRGSIFRFLCKPASPEDLVAALDAGTEQHHLLVAERELLEQTLRGSVRALVDTLALANPISFARAARVRTLVQEQMAALGIDDWQIEVAAMLSQVGAVTLPADLVAKVERGEALNHTEQEIVDRLPSVTEHLLAHIPRLDSVRLIISEQRRDAAPSVPLGARMLRLATDLEALETRDVPRAESLAILSARANHYDRELLDALAARVNGAVPEVHEVRAAELTTGMVIAHDVTDHGGRLLVGRGHEVHETMIQLIRNHAREGHIDPTLLVFLPRPGAVTSNEEYRS